MQLKTNELIKVVEEERTKRKLNQGEFSKMLGISESYYSMVINGKRKPNLFILSVFKQKLPELNAHVDSYINYLTGGDDHNHQKGQ